ncbi:hypothetical protein J4464_05925 [Candidatus Woesearchaeota archaeon]|nr:hypothetical protein [Candidatus Woesearchaeota archaeon]
MWPFHKKKAAEQPKQAADDDDEEEGEKQIPQDAALGQKVELIQADITKITGTLESLKEMRKSTTERFGTMNEQIGELRGQVNDTQRTVGMIEVKATKAADLVESVHPDKLMIQLQKEDGKIEGLRGILEAKEEMLRNVMDQLKRMRDQMGLYRGIEQVIKLNEEVKDELMKVKKITATVERHADRVENVFIESQKSFEAFNTFADKLEALRSDLKELGNKVDKLEIANATFVKKSEFTEKLAIIEKSDKDAKRTLTDLKEIHKKIDERFAELAARVRGEFNFRIEKAELLSHAVERLLEENPVFAQGLKLQEYLHDHIGGPTTSAAEAKGAAPDPKLVEGMTPVK